jgi:Regulator of chromosome condensation (RCC1) repeat
MRMCHACVEYRVEAIAFASGDYVGGPREVTFGKTSAPGISRRGSTMLRTLSIRSRHRFALYSVRGVSPRSWRTLLLMGILAALTLIIAPSPAAATAEGHLVSWPAFTNPPTGDNFIAVSASYDYSLALRSDGMLAAWGANYYGTVSGVPQGSGFVAVAAGYDSATALRSDGSLVSWGANPYGEASDTPTRNDFTAVSCGVQRSGVPPASTEQPDGACQSMRTTNIE